MSGKGLVQTLASVVSPAVGALLVAKIGFQSSFILLGIVLIAIGLAACFFIQDLPRVQLEKSVVEMPKSSFFASIPWTFYSIPLALSCSQGILFFELPLIPEQSIMTSGLLFSIVSIGALCTLSLLFLEPVFPGASQYHRHLRIGSDLLCHGCPLATAICRVSVFDRSVQRSFISGNRYLPDLDQQTRRIR